MACERLEWKTVDTGLGWNRHEGQSENYGPYTIEKEDEHLFSVWWGGVELGEADHFMTARRKAQAHCNGLQHNTAREGKDT